MHKEDQRYQSFSQDWPHPLQNFGPTPVKLAKSGFYLSPTVAYKDRVVCFCCGIALVNWQKDHDPWNEHGIRSPTCGFVTGNYQTYSSEAKRLASFVSWPLPSNYAANPQKLASAGFYAAPRQEYPDRSVCFCCGIALVRWEVSDDPWTEHLEYSKKSCPFATGKEVGNVPISHGPEEQCEGALKTMINKLREKGLDPATTAPSFFLCPITQDIFLEPVFAEDGHTYEKDAIKKWFETHNTSPLTNKKLYSTRIIPNHNLNAQIIDYIENLYKNEPVLQEAQNSMLVE